jgi:hypothetical protein
LARIAELEQDLLGRDRPKHKTIAACIDSVIPKDRPFGTIDIVAGLEALDPKRVWRKRSIDGHICRLRFKGLLRRLQKAHGHECAVYVRVGVQVAPLPFEGQTLPEAIESVLGELGPLNATELTVALLERGYHTTMDKKALRDRVGVVLRKRD